MLPGKAVDRCDGQNPSRTGHFCSRVDRGSLAVTFQSRVGG